MAHAAATLPTAYGALSTIGTAGDALSVQDAEAASAQNLFAQVIMVVRIQPVDTDGEVRMAARRAATSAVEALLIRKPSGIRVLADGLKVAVLRRLRALLQRGPHLLAPLVTAREGGVSIADAIIGSHSNSARPRPHSLRERYCRTAETSWHTCCTLFKSTTC